MMRYLLLLGMMLLMSGCDALDNWLMPPAGTLLNDRSIIFTTEIGSAYAWAADYSVANKLADKDGYWMPAAADIQQLEIALVDALSKNERWYDPSNDVTTYYRQYFGFSVEGTRYIYGAFFCNANNFDWQQHLVFVMDGGLCFIDLAYNPATGEFAGLYIHGEA